MEILSYEPDMSSELASAYNSVIRGVPHCYPVDPEVFASVLSAAVGEGEDHSRLRSEEAFVAREGSAILGFIHVAIERPEKENEAPQGIIRFFWYERGYRRAGQALLNAAEDYFRQRGIAHITAFPQHYRYPFYHLKHAYLSEHLDQVHAILGFNGYRPVIGEVFLDWVNYDPVTPTSADVTVDISLRWRKGGGKRPGLVVLAYQGGREVGVCESVSCGDFSRADEAQDWLFTTWLGVAEQFQGRKLGLHLLQRTLREMHAIGYRHAAISTDWQNFRAFLFYSNYGYRVVDWTYALGRELEGNF